MVSGLSLGSWWVVFIGTFFLGESVILAAAALAAQGTLSVWSVAGWAFAGTVLSDTVWFTSAGRGISAVNRDEDRASRLARHGQRLDRWTGEHPHRALLFIKFVYGTRILSITYLAWRRVAPVRFVGFDAAGTAIWLAVIVPVGFFGGRGLELSGVDLTRFEAGLAVAVVVAVLVRALLVWWRSRR